MSKKKEKPPQLVGGDNPQGEENPQAGEQKRPQIIGPMLETHAGFYEHGPDDSEEFGIGSLYVGREGRYLKHEFAWERLGDEGAAPDQPVVAAPETKTEEENKREPEPES